MTGEEWSKVLDISLNGFFYVTQPLLKNMLVKRYGRIVNIVSLSGIQGMPGQSQLPAAKGRNSRYQSTGTGSCQEESNSQCSSPGIHPYGYDGRN